MFIEAENNFTSFPPLGAVLVTMLGIGVAERSGLIGTSLKLLVEATQSLISVVVVFAGVMSSMAADAGYVVLTPLGAVLFAGMGRHPSPDCVLPSPGREVGFPPIYFSPRSILCSRALPNQPPSSTTPKGP